MAGSIDTGNKSDKKEKPQRQALRVDFTPMVDMNMLLITFFMFCTTLSIPQAMDLVMPAETPKETNIDPTLIPESRTMTILLGKSDKVYYYFGKPKYEDLAALHETSFAPQGGIRDIILEKNNSVMVKMMALKKEKKEKNMSDAEFKERAHKIKDADDSAIIVIKPMPESNYANLIDILDEMAICNIGMYAVDNLAEGDKHLIQNYEDKATLTAKAY